mgnify:CR=1 FL=1
MSEDFFFKQVAVPESILFGYPSRISSIYEPAVERVIQKSLTIPDEKVTVFFEHTTLPSYPELRNVGIRSKIYLFNEQRKFGLVEKLGEQLVYDARYIDNNNMTHLIQHHLTALGFINSKLGITCNDVIVLLDRNAPKLAIDVIQLAGYEVLLTSRKVACNSVHVKVNINNFFHLLPYVKCIDIPTIKTSFPDKIFLSRRNTRKLINEAEVDECLCGVGYEKVYFEEISIVEQWSIMKNATNIVAIHGAALGALAFADLGNKKLNLLELFSPGLVVNSFRKYVAMLDGNWVACRGEITPQIVRDIDIPAKVKNHAFDDFKVSVESIEEALMYLAKY